jgi:phosphatidylethanolamine/phosphatidyl-N-methylethanolamine N-methyltransferase
MAADASVFFALWLQKPLRVAAATPNGGRFTDAIAAQIDLARAGPVLELGAGTGSQTRGLIRAGCPPGRIVALEREPGLAKILRRKLLGVTVIEGDATRIGRRPAIRVQRLSTVVSSLPIKWISPVQQEAVVRPCLDHLGRGGRFVRVAKAFRSPLAMDQFGITGCEVGRVWFNMLLTQIWCYWDARLSSDGEGAI